MLASPGKQRYNGSSAANSVHNYYEHLVMDEIRASSKRALEDTEFLADMFCIALNQLPPRYVRHDVDTTFSLSPEALGEIHQKVKSAVSYASEYLEAKEKEQKTQSEPEPESKHEPESEYGPEPGDDDEPDET